MCDEQFNTLIEAADQELINQGQDPVGCAEMDVVGDIMDDKAMSAAEIAAFIVADCAQRKIDGLPNGAI